MKLRMVLTVLRRWVRTGEAGRDGCAVLMCNGDEGSVLTLVFDERNSRSFLVQVQKHGSWPGASSLLSFSSHFNTAPAGACW